MGRERCRRPATAENRASASLGNGTYRCSLLALMPLSAVVLGKVEVRTVRLSCRVSARAPSSRGGRGQQPRTMRRLGTPRRRLPESRACTRCSSRTTQPRDLPTTVSSTTWSRAAGSRCHGRNGGVGRHPRRTRKTYASTPCPDLSGGSASSPGMPVSSGCADIRQPRLRTTARRVQKTGSARAALRPARWAGAEPNLAKQLHERHNCVHESGVVAGGS